MPMTSPKTVFPLLLTLVICLLAGAGQGWGQQAGNEEAPDLAMVNGEAITLDDLVRKVSSFHGGMGPVDGPTRKPDVAAMLGRIIDVTLILQEARAIGLDELPEVTRRIEQGRMDILRRMIAEKAVAGVMEGDPVLVDQIYREAVRRVRVETLLFPSEEPAISFVDSLDADTGFEEASRRSIEAGEAQGTLQSQSLEVDELWPQAAAALLAMKAGEVSRPIQLQNGFIVVHLLEFAYPDDAAARATAEAQALQVRRGEALQAYTEEMRQRYVEIDRELVDSLDFDAGGTDGVAAFRSDERIVASVLGGDAITVAELTQSLDSKFFHGMKRAVGRKQINDELLGVLDRLTLERSAELEADRVGIIDSEEFAAAVEDFSEGLVFNAFVSRVIHPDVKLDAAELKALYQESIEDHSTPEMVRLDALVFRRRDDAEAALDKLRQGSDLQWMRRNAKGQISATDDVEILRFGGNLLVEAGLPDGVRAAIAGAVDGDFRFYGEEPGPFYALQVQARFPAVPRSFDEVREQIAKKAFGRKRQEALEAYTRDLRAASEIRILVDEDEVAEWLGLDSAGDS